MRFHSASGLAVAAVLSLAACAGGGDMNSRPALSPGDIRDLAALSAPVETAQAQQQRERENFSRADSLIVSTIHVKKVLPDETVTVALRTECSRAECVLLNPVTGATDPTRLDSVEVGLGDSEAIGSAHGITLTSANTHYKGADLTSLSAWMEHGTFACAAPPGVAGASDTGAPSATVAGFEAISPEVAASLAAKAAGRPVEAGRWMVAAANPHAVAAGARVLREGGSAADAMVAVQAVLGLVEPQSSGLSGGAFLVWYDAATGGVTTLDGRETAPLAATPGLFQTDGGAPMGFFDAVVGGRSVGVPGTPALMRMAHEKWEKSDRRGLSSEAIALAEDGFPVSPRPARSIAWDAQRLARHPATAVYFLPGGTPPAAGAVVTNQAYADVLKEMAADGVDPFYTGSVAEEIVTAVRGSETGPGVLTMADLAIYRAKERAAVCVAYRLHEVCGMGPPSSDGLRAGASAPPGAPFQNRAPRLSMTPVSDAASSFACSRRVASMPSSNDAGPLRASSSRQPRR